jgi:acyl dehydratase
MQYYEDLEPGTTTRGTLEYLVTEDEILEMGRRWDPQPFHTDPVAAEDSPFGGLVASTVHLFAISAKVGMAQSPVAAVSSLALTNFINHAPARPADRLRFDREVLDRRPSQSRPGTGVVTFRNELRNQHDELVFSYENTALVHCRP